MGIRRKCQRISSVRFGSADEAISAFIAVFERLWGTVGVEGVGWQAMALVNKGVMLAVLGAVRKRLQSTTRC